MDLGLCLHHPKPRGRHPLSLTQHPSVRTKRGSRELEAELPASAHAPQSLQYSILSLHHANQNFFFGVPMSFRRVGWVAAIAVATLLELSCGQVYRPVVIPVGTNPPNPENFHAVFGISSNAPFNPGAVLQIDVSGDSNIGEENMGVNPTHAAILPNHSRVFVASAGSLYTGDADVVTAFFPAPGGSAAQGLSAPTIFTLPNVGANQSSGILSISEAGTVVTMTLSAPLINAQTGAAIVISNVIDSPDVTNPNGYDGNFTISSVNGATITYVDSITGLTALSATSGTATVPVPLFCRYFPDYVTASQSTAIFVANYGDENGPLCNLISTDSIAALNPVNNTITQIQYLAPGVHPVAMVETPNNENLYVLNQGNNVVQDLSPLDLSTLATISVGNIPAWAVARIDNRRIYVVTQGDGTLVPIDTSTNAVLPSQTNLSVGTGANFVLYDPNLNRLYVPSPNLGEIFVYSATGGVDLSGNANDTPTLLKAVCVNGSAPPCLTGNYPVSVAALPDGSRFYVASFQTQTSCADLNVGSGSTCMVPMLTVFDALSMTIKPATASVLNPSLSLLTSPQFASTQYAVPPIAACMPDPIYNPSSTSHPRFRMFTTASEDSSHVYVSICDASSIADIQTNTDTIATGTNNSPDQLVTNIAPPFGACAIASGGCSTVYGITAFSIASNVITFTSVNAFVAGQKISITGMTSTAGTALNGLTMTVLNTGLSPFQFECNYPGTITDVSTTTDTGQAVPIPAPQNPIFLLTGQ